MPDPYYQLRMFVSSSDYREPYVRIDIRYYPDCGERYGDDILSWWVYRADPESVKLRSRNYVATNRPPESGSTTPHIPPISAAVMVEAVHYITNLPEPNPDSNETREILGVKHYV